MYGCMNLYEWKSSLVCLPTRNVYLTLIRDTFRTIAIADGAGGGNGAASGSSCMGDAVCENTCAQLQTFTTRRPPRMALVDTSATVSMYIRIYG